MSQLENQLNETIQTTLQNRKRLKLQQLGSVTQFVINKKQSAPNHKIRKIHSTLKRLYLRIKPTHRGQT